MAERCIYCGSDTDLSESDIIPDALTNARILNKCVCRIEHNNKFSDKFESKVIEALAFITNELDIKSSKGKKYALYEAIITIEGVEYKLPLHGDNNIFDEKVLRSVDNTQMIGPYEKMVKIAKDEDKVTPLDVNSIEIEKRVRINNEIFFDDAFYRMVSKIAFEWYCAKNHITEHKSEFDDIVNYIVDGVGERPVSIIQEKQIYDMLNRISDLGSHVLIGYENKDGQVEVIVDLFGLLVYRVVLANRKPMECKRNFLYIELRTDASRIELNHANREEASKYFENAFISPNMIQAAEISGIKIMVPRDMPAPIKNLKLYPQILNMVQYFENANYDATGPNNIVNAIFLEQLKRITQASLLHKKSIKRFVNDLFRDGHDPIILNTKSSNKKSTFLFYCLYLIGKIDGQITDSAFQNLVKNEFNINISDEIVITDELEELLKQKLSSDINYSEILEHGAKKVKEWQ